MSNYNLYLTLSQEEKRLLQEKAKINEMSLTAFIRSFLPLEPITNKPTMFIPANKLNYPIGSKQKYVKVYFTDNEMNAIKYMANGEPLSRFISRRALQGEHVLNIEIDDDDDYDFVYSVIEPLYTSIYNYLYSLKALDDIHAEDIMKFIIKLEEANKQLIKLTEYFKKRRASLKKTRLNELRKLSNFYLKDYELISVDA